MQSRDLCRKLTKGFLDRLYRHARESGQVSRTPTISPPLLRGRQRGGGFRLALAVASLAGMTAELFNGFRTPEKTLIGPPMKTFRGDNVGINFHTCFLSGFIRRLYSAYGVR
jgi:hypothetical protein